MRDTPTFIARIVPSVTAILGIATASLLVSSVFWYTHQRRDKQEDNGQRYTKISSLLGVKDLLLGRLIVGEKFQKEDCTLMQQQRNGSPRTCTIGGYESLIGNTPLIRLTALSQLLGREILLKMECLNPGGTGKDRAALWMLNQAEKDGLLVNTSSLCPHEPLDRGVVVEGTSGSTGIALAALCASRNHDVVIVMPDDQAVEKQDLLRCYGATVHVVSNCAISNPNHYVNIARRIAIDMKRDGTNAVFIDQFENVTNERTHYETTGPEIWTETGGCIDAFVMSSGTGGTIAGVGRYLKEKSRKVKVVLVDPPGSSLYNKVKYGVAFASEQRERGMRRHRYDTIAEGIGLDRITRNFSIGLENGVIDDAIQISDQEAVDMAHWLMRKEGLFVGSSSAMNIAGATKVAKTMRSGSVLVTICCDSGQRHLTRFWNRDFILNRGLYWPGDSASPCPPFLSQIG